MNYLIDVNISDKTLSLISTNDNKTLKTYSINTSHVGPGELSGSNCTPRGKHIVRAKIGTDAPENTIFRGRRPTGEIYKAGMRDEYPKRDWILSRILWLSGKEPGKNRLGNVDTMRRYIYIHGCPDEYEMGRDSTIGCINMKNDDLIELFDTIPVYTQVNIK